MNIALTGASGFLGKTIIDVMQNSHHIVTLGRQKSNQIQCDLSCEIPELQNIEGVIHAAGKAHIYPKTEAEKQAFFDVNVNGTSNLLKALKNQKISKFVFISSVSVYGVEKGSDMDETTPLNGKSPYALSKIQAEQMIQQWCEKKKINYLILRLPLVVGPKPLGNLGKMIKAIQKGRYLRIAKGDAQKSMVLSSDVAHCILQWITAETVHSGIYNLTDGYHPTFFELEEKIKTALHKKSIPTIPYFLAQLLGKIGDSISMLPVNSATIQKITCTFTFSDAKAKREIAWSPNLVLENIEKFVKF
jgi:nucleoside-diphosphate-sugar epimerase